MQNDETYIKTYMLLSPIVHMHMIFTKLQKWIHSGYPECKGSNRNIRHDTTDHIHRIWSIKHPRINSGHATWYTNQQNILWLYDTSKHWEICDIMQEHPQDIFIIFYAGTTREAMIMWKAYRHSVLPSFQFAGAGRVRGPAMDVPPQISPRLSWTSEHSHSY